MVNKKRVERSTSYPSVNVEEAFARLVQLKDSMGLNGNYKRETVAKGIGYNTITGTSARSVAALVHYGLLIRDKDTYSISPNGRRFLSPNDDNDQPAAIREAALSPKLFEQLFSDYEGQVLPKLIGNILANKYGVQEKVAPTVVKLFESSMTYAGLLGANGLLEDSSASVNKNEEPSKVDEMQAENYSATTEDTPTSVSPLVLSIQSDKQKSSADSFLNEQGTNHSGDGWSLTVLLRTSHRLDKSTRDKIRSILATADSLADDLYELDEQDRPS